LELLEKLGAEVARPRSIVLIGHDLGAAQALALAPLLGERLRAVVLFNGLSIPQMWQRWKQNPSQRWKSAYMGLFQVPGLGRAIARLPPRWRSALKPREAQLEMSLWQEPMRAYRAMLREVPSMVSERNVPLRVPVLVIWGERDPYLDRTNLQEWSSVAVDVCLRVVDCGHWPQVDQSERCVRYVKEFLENVR
jgi:pimeloyl-ACP methyl ester carboxylesterase